jgi:hypothetical protein
MPNCREELACPECGLISRVRLRLAPFLEQLDTGASLRGDVTEQASRESVWLRRRFPEKVGSESCVDGAKISWISAYLAQLSACDCRSIHHEDVRALPLLRRQRLALDR